MVAVVLGAVGFFVQALHVLGQGCEVVLLRVWLLTARKILQIEA